MTPQQFEASNAIALQHTPPQYRHGGYVAYEKNEGPTHQTSGTINHLIGIEPTLSPALQRKLDEGYSSTRDIDHAHLAIFTAAQQYLPLMSEAIQKAGETLDGTQAEKDALVRGLAKAARDTLWMFMQKKLPVESWDPPM